MTEQRFLFPTDERKRRRKVYATARWEQVRAAALARDQYRCHWCGSPGANIGDHLTDPLDDWEHRYTLSNVVAACRSCNARRGRPGYGGEPKRSPLTIANGLPASRPPGPVQSPRLLPVTSAALFTNERRIAELPTVAEEPIDHRHGRWSTAFTWYQPGGPAWHCCPRSCTRAPVRWPDPLMGRRSQ